ncbi:MAG: N-acetylmuramoyl-L-alanine amidase [Chloroflexi bacterium]|nr:N-acetylmuramoyl-L-alanine amidase [Chloroflexota bacterium]
MDFYSQKAKGYLDAGIRSLIILTYDTYPGKPPFAGDWNDYIARFANRAGQIAQRFAPFRPAYQIWNEPDHDKKNIGTAYDPCLREEVFGQMLRRTRNAIKQADPQALTVIGGLASGNPSWLTTVINSLGGDLPADIVAFHPYGQRPEPNWPNPNWAFGYVGNLLNNYYRAGKNKPLWITEMGVKEEDVGNNRDQAADFLRRYYNTITSQFSGKVQELFWFCYGDGMVPTFGLKDGNGNPKPAYNAFRQAAAARPKQEPAPVVTTPPEPQPLTPVAPPPALSPLPVVTPPSPPQPETPAGQDLSQLITQTTTLQNLVQQLQTQQGQLQTQVQQLSGQQGQLQTQVQQLSGQQTQLQGQVQQLAAQLAAAPAVPTTPSPPAAKPAPPIQNITNQLKRDPNQQFPTHSLDQIQMIIIHHTAVAPTVGADRIAEHRVDKQGWPGIGYHYFITYDGQIQQTNELATAATHAGNYNPMAIGICFAGDFTTAIPTAAQIDAGAQLIAWLLPQFKLSLDAVFGYKQLVNTQSPGLQWDGEAPWGDQLKQKIQAYL